MFRRWQPDLLLLVPLYQLEMLMHRLFPFWLLQPRWRRVYEMPVPKNPTDHDGVEFRWAAAADIPLLEAQLGERLTATRLSYGHRAAILVKDAKLIGIVWFATRGYYDIDTGTRVTLSFDEAWVYGAWIQRRHRGRGLYRHLLQQAGIELRRRGVRHLLLAIDAMDVRSQRVHRRLQAQRVGHLFGVQLAFYKAYRFHREPLLRRA